MKTFITFFIVFLSSQLFASDIQTDLYQKIYDELHGEYQSIGEKEARNILDQKKLSVTGGLNSVGLSYHRPFGEFSVNLDRNLAPDLMDDSRWIVTDTFTLQIDAQKVMQGLQNEKIIDLSAKELSAFAGLLFKRSFIWVHYANSYEDGLSRHFEKLFFPFYSMKLNSLLGMQEQEMIIREDSLSMALGANMVITPGPVVGLGAAGIARFSRLSRLEVMALDEDRLQISMLKEKRTSAGLSLKMEALFFRVIELTLLTYDFEYESMSGHKLFTEIKKTELNDPLVSGEFEKVLKGRAPESEIIAPYIISEEKTIATKRASSFHFLLFGNKKSAETQMLKIEKDNKVLTFFRHSFEFSRYTEHFVSGLFARIFGALTQIEVSPAKVAYEVKALQMEYRSEEDLLDSSSTIDIRKNNGPTLNFSSEFLLNTTTGPNAERNKKRAVDLLEKYSGVDQQVGSMIESGELKGPLFMTGKFQINKDGLDFFNSLSVSDVFDSFKTICDERPKTLFSFFRALSDHCRVSLEENYINYLRDLGHEMINAQMIDQCWQKADNKFFFGAGKKRAFIKNCLNQISQRTKEDKYNVPLWSLKNFSDRFLREASSKVHFYNLFGLSNVFFYGHIEGLLSDGRSFTGHFHEGAFKGLGSVDQYMRESNLISSDSLIINQ